jgi:uncharacterized membrane protein YkoI
MKTPRHSRFCLAILALAAGSALAGDRAATIGDESRRDDTRRAQPGRIILADSGMSLDQAVSMVEKRFKARVVRTETRTEGDRKIYVLRLLNDAGRVWTVRVDASSGSVS